MKKKVIGYLFWDDEKKDKNFQIFKKIAKKKNIELIGFNLMKELREKEVEEKIKKCDIIFNNSAEEFALEFVKTIESLGKKVIESSKISYYTEDKWLFFLLCKKNKIPTLNTILLSENINLAKKELKEFGHWPVILKRIYGTCGEYVEKAGNLDEAEKIMKKFWKQGSERIAIIAQEFIKSPSYRVTLIDGKIIQTAIKESSNWKKTGISSKSFKKINLDKELETLMNKLSKKIKIKVCGVDLLKKEDKWLVLEVNSTPGLDFFEDEREMLIEKILLFLKKHA